MSIFMTILLKIIPLYLMIYLGFVATKYLEVGKEGIAKLLIYMIGPVVIFYGTYTVQLNFANLTLPLLFLIISCLICLLFLWIGNKIFKNDSTKNILAFTSGTGNTGYFGLPVVMGVLGEEAFSLAVLSILGFVLYENTLGFFITAKGSHTAYESFKKVLKLPTVYAFFAGLTLNYLGFNLGELAVTTIQSFKGAYTLLGMMLIGMGLSSVKRSHIDFKFMSLTFLAKFLIWPAVVLSIIVIDNLYLNFYSAQVHSILILMSIVPLAANTVALATELKVHPDKAAIAVLISTIFALFYIPTIMLFF
ncbi:transporter [bacterium]|nr:transporter [bacterium]